MKVEILIEESVVQKFIVEVETNDTDEATEQAMNIAEEKYKSGEFVLDNGEVSARQMSAVCDGEWTDWVEF